MVKEQDENLIFFGGQSLEKKNISPYLRIRNILKFKAI